MVKRSFSFRLDWLKTAALLYLYIPIFIFLLTWVNLFFALPIGVLGMVMLFLLCQKNPDEEKQKRILTKQFLIMAVLTFIFIGIWCSLSGLGGFTEQTGDWKKHNVLLRDLIDKPWPVRYDFNGEGVMSYYIAGYLIPAIVGKILNFDYAQIAMLIWAVIGIFIACLYLYRIFGKNKPSNLLVSALVIFAFSTFIIPLAGIYMQWSPKDAGGFGHWISHEAIIQYSSNITLLRWVFPQFVPTLIAVALFIKEKERIDRWLPLVTPLALYSTFTFLGLGIVMFFKFVIDLLHKNKEEILAKVKAIFSIINLLTLPLLCLLLVYIAGNILQSKPASAGMNFGILTHKHTKLALILFQLSWLIWFFILYKREKTNSLFWASSITLFILPFFIMGRWNDLCMRASIPALLIYNCIVLKNLLCTIKQKNVFFKTLVIGLIITGFGSFGEIRVGLFNNGIGIKRYNDTFAENTVEFYYFEPNTLYQYISWEPERFLNRILQK